MRAKENAVQVENFIHLLLPLQPFIRHFYARSNNYILEQELRFE